MKDKTTQRNKHCRENSVSSSNLWLKKAMHKQKGTCQENTEQLATQFPMEEVTDDTKEVHSRSRCSQLTVSSLRGGKPPGKRLGKLQPLSRDCYAADHPYGQRCLR